MTTTVQTHGLEHFLGLNNAFLHPSLTVADSEEAGVHLHAHAPLPTESTLVSVPHTLALSYLNALVDDDWPVFKKQRHRFKVEAIGFWYLCAQYLHREDSFWEDYLSSLPSPKSELTQPLFFEDEDDVAWLKGTDVWHTHLQRTEVHRGYYDEGIEVLRGAGVDVQHFTW